MHLKRQPFQVRATLSNAKNTGFPCSLPTEAVYYFVSLWPLCDDFRWFTEPQEKIKTPIESNWVSNMGVTGFRLVSTHAETNSATGDALTHMLFSDGLANVSVFI